MDDSSAGNPLTNQLNGSEKNINFVVENAVQTKEVRESELPSNRSEKLLADNIRKNKSRIHLPRRLGHFAEKVRDKTSAKLHLTRTELKGADENTAGINRAAFLSFDRMKQFFTNMDAKTVKELSSALVPIGLTVIAAVANQRFPGIIENFAAQGAGGAAGISIAEQSQFTQRLATKLRPNINPDNKNLGRLNKLMGFGVGLMGGKILEDLAAHSPAWYAASFLDDVAPALLVPFRKTFSRIRKDRSSELSEKHEETHPAPKPLPNEN